MSGPDEANIARVIALRLGFPQTIPAWTVQRNCASGMQALDSAYHNIASGLSDLILAGGTEAMSCATVLYNDAMVNMLADLASAKTVGMRLKAFGKFRPGHLKPIIALLRGLSDPLVGMSMGQTTEQIAYRFDISRDQMDSFSVASHQRLVPRFSRALSKLFPTAGFQIITELGSTEDPPCLGSDKPSIRRTVRCRIAV